MSNRTLCVLLLTVLMPYVLVPLLALCYLTGWRLSDLDKEP